MFKLLRRNATTATPDPAHVHIDPAAATAAAQVAAWESICLLRGREALDAFNPSDPATAAWLRARGLPENYGARLAAWYCQRYADLIAGTRSQAGVA